MAYIGCFVAGMLVGIVVLISGVITFIAYQDAQLDLHKDISE